jgi:hypothetical protein
MHRCMRAMAMVTAGHTTALRGRKLRVELKNQTWPLIKVASVRLTARRYVLEDICEKLLHLLLIDRRESKPKGRGQRGADVRPDWQTAERSRIWL